jgi:hypothetical protein
MKITNWLSVLALAGVVALGACGSAPKTESKKEPEKPPEPVTGRYATYQAYLSARTWAQDLEVFQAISVTLPEVASGEGKYPMWRITFVSPSKRARKTYNYSVTDSQGIYKGIFSGPDEAYSGPVGQNAPFSIQALKIDSDEALKTAMDKGAAYAKKNPAMPISFLLENTKRFPNPTWRVIWGDSVATSAYSIYVDAATGDYLQTMR